MLKCWLSSLSFEGAPYLRYSYSINEKVRVGVMKGLVQGHRTHLQEREGWKPGILNFQFGVFLTGHCFCGSPCQNTIIFNMFWSM